MDEELAREWGARDAADADVAGAAAGSAGGWDRLRDGLGDPAGFRTGEGGERDPLPLVDEDGTSQEQPSSLVELTGAAARTLRTATTRARLDAAAACRLSSSDVLAGFADIGEARARLEVAEQVLLGEVMSRGLAQEAGFSVPDYVRTALGRRAPLPEASTVAAAVQVARATAPVQEAGLGASLRDHVPGGDVVREAVFSTALSVGRAAQITRFARDVAPVADDADLAEWVDGFVTAAADVLPPADVESVESAEQQSDRGPDAPGAGRGADARQLHRALQQARLIVKPARDLEDDERRRRQGRAFTRTDGGCSATGMAHYRLVLDPEGAAIIDSAVSALSAPRRLEDGTLEPGETTDPRSAATRRADALLELVGRAVSAGGGTPAPGSSGATDGGGTEGTRADGTRVDGTRVDGTRVDGTRADGGDAATGSRETASGPLPGLGDKTQVLVTIDLLALTGMLDRAGITSTGEILSAATVRRLACEAGIIPAVLGADGQVLDLGRTRRLFTPGQRLIVWRRDKHCSYPGCTMPATWCDVHHVDWWSRGGPTDLANAALLCRRHHTFVHQHGLTATVTERGVSWHAPPPAPPPTPPPRR